jgi:parallel beta-helix repeat protein
MPDFGREIDDQDYDFVVFIDAEDSNRVKAKSGDKQGTEFSHATDLGNVLNSIHGSLSSTSGGTIKVKTGSYGWATTCAITKGYVTLHFERGAVVTPTTGFASDIITVNGTHFQIDNAQFDCSNMSNGTGTWLTMGTSTTTDFPRVLNCRVKNAPTHGILMNTNCNGAWISNCSIQSTAAPTGDAIRATSNADHHIVNNDIGGYANATNGIGIHLNSAVNCVITGNEVYVNRIGLKAYYPVGHIISNNLIQTNQQHGMVIQNDTSTLRGRCTIVSNRIHDNGTALANTYDGIQFAISSTGGFDNMAVVGNMCSDQTVTVGSKTQRYGISVNSALLTNSVIAANACAGNRTGGILVGTHASSLIVINNTGYNSGATFVDLSESGITALRTYTFPDANALVAGQNFANTMSAVNTFSAINILDNAFDHKVISAPADPGAGYVRPYAKQIDSNNDGYFLKKRLNGAVVEVQLA